MSDPMIEFIEATMEMCEAWDALRSMLDRTDGDDLTLEEGSLEIARRTKRMVEARQRIAKAARTMEALV